MASDKEKAGSCTGSKENSNLTNDECKDQPPKQRPLQGRTTGPTRRSTKGQWTAEEDAILSSAVQAYKGRNWKKIAECFPDRTDVQCLHRWQKVLNPELVKGPWSKEEDDIIIEMVNIHGAKKWSVIAQALPGRIGKQCRERWHNHLNPAINKQAWTQEEEMALIQAHQIYGNKWAELTKFLPGRTDNAIKNHWNSSVKKKLDFYLSSGLLAQFQGLPHTENSSQCISLSSDGKQQNASEIFLKEESSECTQGSAQVCCSFSEYDADTVPINEKEEVREGESTGQANLQIQHSATFLEEYNNSLEYAKHDYLEASEVGISVNTFSEDFYKETAVTAALSSQTGLSEGMISPFQEESERSIGLSELPGDCCHASNSDCGSGDVCPASSSGFNVPICVRDEDFGADKQGELQMTETDLSCNNHSGNPMLTSFPLGDPMATTTIMNLESYANSAICNANAQNSEAIDLFNSISQPHPPCSSEMLCIPNCEGMLLNVAGPCLIYSSNGQLMFQSNPGGAIASHQVQDSDLITCICDDCVNLEGSMSLSSHGGDSKTLVHHLPTFQNHEKEEVPTLKDKEKLCATGSHLCSEEKSKACLENLDSEALCYEPPRFPSIDLPFLSCDLVSSADILQAYSPLGMRQLTMPSINCSSPYGLWDTASGESSPDAFLRNAAKSFLCTPSILKKRQRELLSPLHERSEKKSARGIGHDLFCSISNNIDSSSKDVICNEGGSFDGSCASSSRILSPHCPTRKSVPPLGQQENGGHVPEESRDQATDDSQNSTEGPSDGSLQRDIEAIKRDVENKLNSNIITEMKSDRIDFEHNNDGPSLSSPAPDGLPETSAKKSISERKQRYPVSLLKPSACTSEKVGSSIDLDFEKLNIFADTPGVKRGIESPSAWKSPWFMNSFLGQRITNDTALEEIGYFLSPGDKTYDAITLMRHLSEHKAVALTESHEILKGGNSGRRLNDGCSRLSNSSTRNNIVQDEDKENCVPSQSNVMVEARVLDFSSCGTPSKGTEHRKLDGGGKQVIKP